MKNALIVGLPLVSQGKWGMGHIEYPNRIEQNVRNTSKTNSNSMTTRKIGILYHFRNGMYVKRKCESHSVGIDWNWLQQPHWAAVCPWFGLATPLFPSSSSSSCPYLHTGIDQSLTSHCPRFHNYISMRHKHGKTAQMVAKVQQYTRLCFYYSCLHSTSLPCTTVQLSSFALAATCHL